MAQGEGSGRTPLREYRPHPYHSPAQTRRHSSIHGHESQGGGNAPALSTVEGQHGSGATAGGTTDIPAQGNGNGGCGNRNTGQRTSVNNSHVMVRMLQQQVQDLRAQNELLQVLVDRQQLNTLPEVCTWSSIRPQMRKNPKQLILGPYKEKNTMYPDEKLVKESILNASDIGADDVITRRQFDRSWAAELKKRVLLSISNRRGRFSTTARNALWRLLGIPKPINGTPNEIAMWKASMTPLYEDCSWRREGDDPFGSDAFYVYFMATKALATKALAKSLT